MPPARARTSLALRAPRFAVARREETAAAAADTSFEEACYFSPRRRRRPARYFSSCQTSDGGRTIRYVDADAGASVFRDLQRIAIISANGLTRMTNIFLFVCRQSNLASIRSVAAWNRIALASAATREIEMIRK